MKIAARGIEPDFVGIGLEQRSEAIGGTDVDRALGAQNRHAAPLIHGEAHRLPAGVGDDRAVVGQAIAGFGNGGGREQRQEQQHPPHNTPFPGLSRRN